MDCAPGGSNSEDVCLSRKVLIDYYRDSDSKNHESKMVYLQSRVQIALQVDNLSVEIKGLLIRLISEYRSRLLAAHRNFSRCYSRNKAWFEHNISFPVAKPARKISDGGGRPQKPFEECTDRTKRRKTENVRKQLEPSQLAFAAQVEYRVRGEVKISNIIKDVALHGADHLSKKHSHETLAAEKALSLVIEAQLTKFQYNAIRMAAKEINCNMYPNYETLIAVKKQCYPEGIVCTEISAEVPLQNLMDHTIDKLFLSLFDVIKSIPKNQLEKMCLISKWGCDGSGSHPMYKQNLENKEQSDAFMFITSIVPIQLISGELGSTNVRIIWQNPRPSSPRYCRPLKLQMAHETTDLSKKEYQNFQAQLNSLTLSRVQVEEEYYFVKHNLVMTMVDGKMVNAITEITSAQRCYLCGTTSKDFNRLKFCMDKPITEEFLKYGISSLHAWIRFTECILHLSYKLKVSKWQVRIPKDKGTVAAEKQRIQDEFWERLGLHVDKPKQGGGTSTDGNTARTFFQNEELVADITGVNLNLIKRLHTILSTLSCGHTINTEKFKSFCHKTAAIFVKNYPWYCMPTTLHKVLIHGHRIVDSSDIAIGLLSEDAQESRNKDVRKYRQQFSRKFSRIQTMQDAFQRLMVSSDPYITGLRQLLPKKRSLSQAVLNLLDEPDIIIE